MPRKQVLTGILISCLWLQAFQTSAQRDYILVKNEGKFGMINSDGEVIVPIDFDYTRSISEGLLSVNKGAKSRGPDKGGGLWGYYNCNGKLIIPLKYEDAYDFSQGLAAVSYQGKWGFINKKGEVVIDFQFEEAKSFDRGRAPVKLAGKWGFIDTSGKMVIPPAYGQVNHFDQGFSVVTLTEVRYETVIDGDVLVDDVVQYGLIDTLGNWVLEPRYEYISSFSDGMARIQENHRIGYIDQEGKIAIPPLYPVGSEFSEGLAAVGEYRIPEGVEASPELQHQFDSLQNEVTLLMDESGSNSPKAFAKKMLNHPAYQQFMKVNKQMPKAKLFYGYIDKTGQQVLPFQYQDAFGFHNGWAKVALNKKSNEVTLEDADIPEIWPKPERRNWNYNLINAEGDYFFDKHYDMLNRAEENIIITQNHLGSRAMNESKEVLIPYSTLTNLRYIGKGFYQAETNKDFIKKVLLNQQGKVIFKGNFYYASLLGSDRIKVKMITKRKKYRKVVRYGIVDENGKWVVKPTYEGMF